MCRESKSVVRTKRGCWCNPGIVERPERRNEASVLLEAKIMKSRFRVSLNALAQAEITLHAAAIAFLALEKGNVTMSKADQIFANCNPCFMEPRRTAGTPEDLTISSVFCSWGPARMMPALSLARASTRLAS